MHVKRTILLILATLLLASGCARWGFAPSHLDGHVGGQDAGRDGEPPDLPPPREAAPVADGGSSEAGGANPVTLQLGSAILIPPYSGDHLSPRWDLTRCPLQLSYTIDVSGLTSAQPHLVFAQVGLRQEGAPDVNPTDAGGWLELTPAAYLDTDPLLLDLDDKLNLTTGPGRDEKLYDVNPTGAIVSPFGTYVNRGIWFDRDGINATPCPAGASVEDYCSGGVYRVVIDFRAVSPTQGTMLATVNTLATGFYTGNWHPGAPEITPAGRSFTGAMTRLELFLGLIGQGAGVVQIRDIVISGCPL